jgi:hypothetical protein
METVGLVLSLLLLFVVWCSICFILVKRYVNSNNDDDYTHDGYTTIV